MTEKVISWKSRKTINVLYAIILIVVVFILLGAGLWWFSLILFRETVFEHETKLSIEHARIHVRNHLMLEERIARWQDPESMRHFEEFTKDVTDTKEVESLNIFDAEGILIFSSENKDRIGTRIEEEKVNKALQGELIRNFISMEEKYRQVGRAMPENVHISGETRLLEVYVPFLNQQEKIIGVVELYLYQDHFEQLAKTIQKWTALFVGISAIIVGGILYIIFRRQNAQVTQHAEEFESIIENAPIGICAVSPKGIIESFNPKMAELLGSRDHKDLMGASIFDLLSCEENNIDELIRKGLQGQFFETEIRDICQVQREGYHHYYGVPLQGGKNKIKRLLLLVEDVTERKRLALELEKHSKNLEAKVEERTRELEEKLSDLSRLNKLMVDRELKMIELKKKVKESEINNLNSVKLAPGEEKI